MNSQNFSKSAQNQDAPSTPSNSGEAATQKIPRRVRASRNKSETAFRTISEVAETLDVQQHVLRFWETKFSQIKPLKRGGGRRFYRPEDMELLKRIHHLLYTEGYTIKGVQKLLREKGKKAFLEDMTAAPMPAASNASQAHAAPMQAPANQAQGLSTSQRDALKSMLGELKELRRMVVGDEA